MISFCNCLLFIEKVAMESQFMRGVSRPRWILLARQDFLCMSIVGSRERNRRAALDGAPSGGLGIRGRRGGGLCAVTTYVHARRRRCHEADVLHSLRARNTLPTLYDRISFTREQYSVRLCESNWFMSEDDSSLLISERLYNLRKVLWYECNTTL